MIYRPSRQANPPLAAAFPGHKKTGDLAIAGFLMNVVAGVGFEPTTFGL